MFYNINVSVALHKKLSVKDFFSKCEHVRWFLQMCLYLLKKSLTENLKFSVVSIVGQYSAFSTGLSRFLMKFRTVDCNKFRLLLQKGRENLSNKHVDFRRI